MTRNLPPLVGGMERLNWHMAEELGRRADVRVIAPEGAAALGPEGVTIHEVPLRPLWRFLGRATWDTVRIARDWRPNLVLAGSGLTALPAWLAARASHARAAAYVHGLDVTASHPIYRSIWIPALRRMERIVANSNATRTLAQEAGISPSRISVVHPGVELPVEELGGDRGERFRADHGLADWPLLLSVGRLSSRKGLLEFVERVMPGIVAAVPNATLLIVGDAPDDALQAGVQSPEAIRRAAASVGLSDRIRFLGRISDAQLNSAYRAADVHVFPVRELPGDPEGFGMVAVEAASHGLPTVAYATGGVRDAVADGISGRLVARDDAVGFAKAVVDMLTAPPQRQTVRAFANDFAWERFGMRMGTALGLD